MQAPTNNPSPAIADLFRVVGIEPGVVVTRKGQHMDLRTVDLATAQQLVADGFPYLEPITPAGDEPAPEPAAEPVPAPATEPTAPDDSTAKAPKAATRSKRTAAA